MVSGNGQLRIVSNKDYIVVMFGILPGGCCWKNDNKHRKGSFDVAKLHEFKTLLVSHNLSIGKM